MNDDPADLSRLADIVAPPPPSWWPPAIGWWLIAAGILAALAVLTVFIIQRYRKNAYRRAALAELAALGAADDAAAAATVSSILKRAALVAYPRATTASLTGPAWLTFLDQTASMHSFSGGGAAWLTQGALNGRMTDGQALIAAAKQWVQRHRVEA